MLVQQILAAKQTQGVTTLAPSALVSEAVALLGDSRIGTVVVSSDGRHAEGIVSERDIVRELGRRGAEVLSLPLSSIMTSRIVTCRATDTARRVAEQMTEGRFRHMPVVEGGEMIGLVSIGDVVKWRLSEVSMEKEALVEMIQGR